MIWQQTDMVHKIVCYEKHHLHESWMTLQIFLQNSLSSFCIQKGNYSKVTSKKRSNILTIDMWEFYFEGNWPQKTCNFYNILARSGIILRMVYMDSGCDGFCIRNAIGGARDEVWQDATLWFMGLQLRIQKWGFDQVINIWDVKIMCIRQFQLKYKCTSIIKIQKIIQNPVDPAGPDCYRIDTKPCESL